MKIYNPFELLNSNEALTFNDVSLVPEKSTIKSRSDVDISTKLSSFKLYNPAIPSNMDTVTEYKMMQVADSVNGLAFLHRFLTIDKFKENVRNFLNNRLLNQGDPRCLGISIGLDDSYIDWVKYALTHAAKWEIPVCVMIDIANGYTSNIEKTILQLQKLKKNDNMIIVAGNVAESESAKFLARLDVDGIRVGIGGGSVCETRIRTGVGVPHLSSIISCKLGLESVSSNSFIICDGGIKTPGDIAKAMAAGADACLCGYIFAGCLETPGDIIKTGIFPNYVYKKVYRGSASADIKKKMNLEGYVEGNVTTVPLKQSAIEIFNEIEWGIRSAFSYLGANNILEFRENARFVKITENGYHEGLPNASK